MAKQVVVTCWNCKRKFEVTVATEPAVTAYKGLDPQDSAPAPGGSAVEIARACPFCGKDNIIRGEH